MPKPDARLGTLRQEIRLRSNSYQAAWVASELRYFDDNPSYPTTALLLCVTQLGSSSAASQDQRQFASILNHPLGSAQGPVAFSVSGIPHAVGYYIGDDHGIVNAVFAKSKYFVFVSAAGLSKSGAIAAQSLATHLAMAQYQRLLD